LKNNHICVTLNSYGHTDKIEEILFSTSTQRRQKTALNGPVAPSEINYVLKILVMP